MTSAKVLIADATDTGKKGPAGHESIWGGAGNDNLIGLSRCDILTDGWGDNTSVFLATIDSRVGNGQRDLITDFWLGHDRIDLAAIDANSRIAGDQAFAFESRAARNAVWFSGRVLTRTWTAMGEPVCRLKTGIGALRATDIIF